MPLTAAGKSDYVRGSLTIDEDEHPKNMGVKKRNWWEKLKEGTSHALKKGGQIVSFLGGLGEKIGALTGQAEIVGISEGLKVGGGLASYVGSAIETGQMDEEKNQEIVNLGKRGYEAIRNYKNRNYEKGG